MDIELHRCQTRCSQMFNASAYMWRLHAEMSQQMQTLHDSRGSVVLRMYVDLSHWLQDRVGTCVHKLHESSILVQSIMAYQGNPINSIETVRTNHIWQRTFFRAVSPASEMESYRYLLAVTPKKLNGCLGCGQRWDARTVTSRQMDCTAEYDID
jgi:hypothetical protein